jgi:hypothetical protein
MKTVAFLAAVILGSFFLTPQAHAGKVGKLAGKYSGSGMLTDKRNAPTFTYQYTFDDLVVKVSAAGKVSGSATVRAAVSSGGSPFFPVGTTSVTATGKVTDFKRTSSKITATGELKFSDGTEVHGTFSVAAKTGKGTYKVNFSDSDLDAKFKVSKKK